MPGRRKPKPLSPYLKSASIFLAAILVAEISVAGELRRSMSFIRPLLMGDAYVAVADEASVESLFDSVGPVDILVNNAGVFSNYLVTAMPADEFRRIMDVNVTGSFLCSRAVARQMKESSRSGVIVNVASVDAISPSAEGLSHYTISKHAIAGPTRTLAPAGIRVNAVCPGATMTEGAIALVTAGAPDGMTLLLNGTGSTIARPSVASASPTTSGGQSCSWRRTWGPS